MDTQLISLLVCPVTKGPLVYLRDSQELMSRSARLAYPVRDGIAVLLEHEARPITDAEAERPKVATPPTAPHTVANAAKAADAAEAAPPSA